MIAARSRLAARGPWGCARALGVLALAVLGLLSPGCGSDPPDRAKALREFLVSGPGTGTWEVQGLSTRRTTWIAPHPEDSGWLLKAEATAEGAARPCVVLRGTVAREFLEGPWELFARNFFPSGPEEQATTRAGVGAVRLRWLPKHDVGGDTARHVWFDRESGTVLQVEDVARDGQLVRGIYRTAADTGGLDPARVRPGGPGGQDICFESDPDRTTLQTLIANAPFSIVAPEYLPAGYERIGARYQELRDAEHEGPAALRLASLLYSDGLGLISVGIALRADMDALQLRLLAMGPGDGEPGGCSTLPPDQGNVEVAGSRVIRRRTDACRTVLRLDGFEGVSITLLSRNELPGDEYVKVMESLARVTVP